MSSSATGPEWIDLSRADDLRDVVHRAVACLAQGGVVGLPTDTGYCLAASALWPEAVGRLGESPQAKAEWSISLGLKGAEEVTDWVPNLALHGHRLARRAWPGPVTIVYEGDVPQGLVRCLDPSVRAVVAPGTALGLRSPGHLMVREILRLTPGPLVLANAHTNGQARLETLFGPGSVDMVLDEGRDGQDRSATIVGVDPKGWRVVRPGSVGAGELRRMAGTMLMFVCTGNTCRSPMAEALWDPLESTCRHASLSIL